MNWVKTIVTPALISTFLSVLISGAFGYFNANKVDQNSKIRTAQLEQIVKFVTSADSLKQGANDYISAIARQKDIGPFQDSLRTEIVKQFNATESLKLFFKNKAVTQEIDQYQSALREFSLQINAATGPTTMKGWVQGFDKVYVLSKDLTLKLTSSVDLQL